MKRLGTCSSITPARYSKNRERITEKNRKEKHGREILQKDVPVKGDLIESRTRSKMFR